MPSVLITGASRGIGRATAIALAARGHRVVATARRIDTLSDLKVDTRLALDVTDPDSVAAAVAAAGDIDAVVNNAGETFLAPVENTPPDELLRLLTLNTVGALRVTQAVLPAMRRRGTGRVLFISSIAGRITLPMTAGYSATKWALEALAEALAVEVRHFGITISLLQPGAVASGALDNPPVYLGADDPYLPMAAQLGLDALPMINVEEVANAVADTIDHPQPPLRIPVGAPAAQMLAARRAADDTTPFLPMSLNW